MAFELPLPRRQVAQEIRPWELATEKRGAAKKAAKQATAKSKGKGKRGARRAK